MKLKAILLFAILSGSLAQAQTENSSLTYHVELGATAGDGTYAPLWFTGNRYGLGSTNPNSGYLLAGISYEKQFKRGWHIEAGLDMAGGIHQAQDVFIHQIYSDFSWKMLTLSIGSKERPGFPLTKNTALSSGMMVEGPNTQPIPQIRGEIKEFLNVPGTKGWLAFKGHIAYGSFTDNGWQKDFVQPGQYFTKDVLYHSKSLMLRLGNKEKLPLEFEFGLLMATQFGGDRYLKLEDGSTENVLDMPDNLKAYWKAFFPQTGGSDTPEGEQVNVEGNMLGSWNFALNYYLGQWKFRAYLEHAGNNSTSGVGMNSKLKYKSQIEATTSSSLLRNIVSTGLYDDAVITLNYELDWNTVNTIAKEYTAQEGREEGLYSHSYEQESVGTNGASGTPGTTSNSGTTYDITDGTTSTSTYTVKEYDYLPNELVTTTNTDPGAIVKNGSSIAVTLIKNVTYEETQAKKLGYLDGKDWDTFKSENSEPVTLNVDNSWVDIISKGTGIDPANISVVAYQKNSFQDKASSNILSKASFWVQIVLAAAILGILVLVIIRSARPLTVEEKEPELSVEEMLASTRENQPSVDDIDLQEKSETRKAIEKFVDENPEAVALLLRNWLNEDWN